MFLEATPLKEDWAMAIGNIQSNISMHQPLWVHSAIQSQLSPERLILSCIFCLQQLWSCTKIGEDQVLPLCVVGEICLRTDRHTHWWAHYNTLLPLLWTKLSFITNIIQKQEQLGHYLAVAIAFFLDINNVSLMRVVLLGKSACKVNFCLYQ